MKCYLVIDLSYHNVNITISFLYNCVMTSVLFLKLLVTSVLGFKARVDRFASCALLPVFTEFIRFTSDARLAISCNELHISNKASVCNFKHISLVIITFKMFLPLSANALDQRYYIILVPVGLIGNFLSILVLRGFNIYINYSDITKIVTHMKNTIEIFPTSLSNEMNLTKRVFGKSGV